MTDDEFARIGEIVSNLPVFADCDEEWAVQDCRSLRRDPERRPRASAGAPAGARGIAREAPRDGVLGGARGRRSRPPGEARGDPLSRYARRRARARPHDHRGNRAGHPRPQHDAVEPRPTGLRCYACRRQPAIGSGGPGFRVEEVGSSGSAEFVGSRLTRVLVLVGCAGTASEEESRVAAFPKEARNSAQARTRPSPTSRAPSRKGSERSHISKAVAFDRARISPKRDPPICSRGLFA